MSPTRASHRAPRTAARSNGTSARVDLGLGAPELVKHLQTEQPATLLRYFREMLLIRRFEEKAAEMYQRAKIGGYCHLNLGEEAACVGLAAGMLPGDYLLTNYREHGYALARGLEPKRVMAELFGREDGVSRGRGGSMHLFSAQKRLLGGYGIVGGQLPIATGAALALVRQDRTDVVVCQMGDATTNIGAFHESLNLASLWQLPIVYVVINNGYGMGTPVAAGSAEPDLYKKASAYRMEAASVDGTDVLAVRDAIHEAVERARSQHAPTLLEAHCLRLRGHSVVDPDRYRSAEYLEGIRAHDPVQHMADLLLSSKLVDPPTLQDIEAEIGVAVQGCVDFADQSPEPNPSHLFEFSYATPVANQPTERPGEQRWR